MYLKTKNKTKNFFIVLLALLMAVTMAFATACTKNDDNNDNGDGGDNNPTTESTLTDFQVLRNGDFEFMTDDKTVFPKSSSISWSNSLDSGLNGNTAPSTSSNGKSGIIDTLDDGTTSAPYVKLDNKYKPKVSDTAYYNPQTPYYYGLVENKFVADKESANYEDNKTNVNASGSKILMIQNVTGNDQIKGTAQKFKSSTSLSVDSDSYAVFSVWVKTKDLESTFTTTPGAYVALDFKIGSITYDTIYFDNIDTDGEWALLKAKINGFEYGSVTASVTLGLGKGNALGKYGYVEGFAYFDNAHFEVFNKQEFDATSDETITVNKEENASIDLSSKTYAKNPTEKTAYSQESSNKFSTFTYTLNFRQTDGLTQNKINGSVKRNTSDSYNTANDVLNKSKIGVSTVGAIPTLTDKVADIDKIGGNNDTSVIYFEFNTLTSATFLSNEIELKSNEYNLVTFFVKSNAVRSTSDMVSVDVIDYVTEDKKSTKPAFDSFTTQDATVENYGDWVKYSIFVDNLTDKDTKYKIQISFGPTDVDAINDALFFQKGYALIANLNAVKVEKDLYDLALASSTLSKISLKGVYGAYGEDEEVDDSDIYNTTVDGHGAFEIQTKPTTNLADYTRKYDETKAISGIINSKYNANYAGINNLDVFANLTSNENKYAQAVVLQNNQKTNSALISKQKTLNKNSFAKIAVKINVSEGATANIYVSTNKLDGTNYEVMKISPNSETYNWTEELKAQVTGETKNAWTEVAFYIASGNEDIEYKVEVWLGDRSGEGVIGTAFMENVIVSDYDESAYMYARDLFIDTYKESADYVSHKHTRAPTTVKETVDGEDVTNTKYYNEREIYNGNNLTKFIDYTTIFADAEIDNTVKEDDTTEDDTTTEEEGYTVKTDVALQISSIIIAVVLIVVMVIVFIRTIAKNRRRRKEYVSSFYDRDSREKTLKKIKDKKSSIVLDDEKDVEYNYDEAEAVEETVIDVDKLNKKPEDLQEDGGSETQSEELETSSEESSEESSETPTSEN